MADINDILNDLKQRRDELRLQIHLASREVQDEWDELEQKMEKFSSRAGLKETGAGVGKALAALGEELKAGYKRVERALKED